MKPTNLLIAAVVWLTGSPAAIAASGPAAIPKCSLVHVYPGYRPEASDWIMAKATADSTSDGTYAERDWGLTRDTVRGDSAQPVFAQVMRVTKASQSRLQQYSIGSKIIVVWWRNDPACYRYYPAEARALKPGEDALIFITPRERRDWIDGRPTFDADTKYIEEFGIYFPSEIQAHNRESMTASEFLSFFPILPTATQFSYSIKQVRLTTHRWAIDHPDLARKEPAITMLRAVWAPTVQERFGSKRDSTERLQMAQDPTAARMTRS